MGKENRTDFILSQNIELKFSYRKIYEIEHKKLYKKSHIFYLYE